MTPFQNLSKLYGIGIIAFLIHSIPIHSLAKEPPSKSKVKKVESNKRMVGCDPPLAYTEFALNNVRLGLESSGKLWNNEGASYEIPKVVPGSGETSVHSIYSGGLWIGGYDPSGGLRVAAVKFRAAGQTDYYNGPLSNNGYATADYCQEYDQFYHARKKDCQIHRAYFQAVANETVDQDFPDGYTIPDYFYDWPGNNIDPNYAPVLAPFYDANGGNGVYDPEEGDYPGYDLDGAIDCKTRNRTDIVPLFGDETLWWVFNDNGGIHTETGSEPIGIEVQAQAFAYSTTDEINNMTFYNYVLINRGTQTLTDTYFGQWLDTDLGCSSDDYVGCDVQRGMGYTYNGPEDDASCDGVNGYGLNPPALGVDFFEGPYQDDDGFYDNPLSSDLQVVDDFNGIPYNGLGIGYGDGIPMNERFGMTKFVYHNIGEGVNSDPVFAIDYYNYLDGKWKNGEPMTYGGDGVGGTTPCNFMFPGDSDPLDYGTYPAQTEEDWTETSGSTANEAGDRRFLQSAGKFTLDPGEFNNITTGVVWVRPFGGRDATLSALKIADDKAQALFDNCFQILSGPDAPDMTAQELENEVILYLSNENTTSNNYRESYGSPPSQFSLDILVPLITSTGDSILEADKHYKFQGYMIYQLKNGTVSSSELDNPDLARLQFQVDIEDGVTQLINYVDDPDLGLKVPVEMVDGTDDGIRHSFSVTEDLFASEGSQLVNFKKYYFMAVAYAYNEYEAYNPGTGLGQPTPFLSSRKAANGAIPVITAIPHNPALESGGTILNASYGDNIPVMRIEGEGNGGAICDISEQSVKEILQSPYSLVDDIEYVTGSSPIRIKVIDPVRVPAGEFRLGFMPKNQQPVSEVSSEWELVSQELDWFLVNESNPLDTIYSHQSIEVGGEQLILDYGISIDISQYEYEKPSESSQEIPEFLEATLEYDQSGIEWYDGVRDVDMFTEQNWIRAGSNIEANGSCDPSNPFDDCYYTDFANVDPTESYENVLGGRISPWQVASASQYGPSSSHENLQGQSITKITSLRSTDIVFTQEHENWTRVPVLEMQHFTQLSAGGAEKLHMRRALSVDKQGLNQLNGGDYQECTMNGTQVMTEAFVADLSNSELRTYKLAAWPSDDPDLHADEELLGLSFGMGWFPGYAIDIDSGERLNMAFGENSALPLENGADMIWNPTSTIWNTYEGSTSNPNNARFGGMHYYYVFRNQTRNDMRFARMPQYDQAQFMHHTLPLSSTLRQRVFRACTWVGLPLIQEDEAFLEPSQGLVPSELKIRLRVSSPYKRFATIGSLYEDYLYTADDEPWTHSFPTFYWEEDCGIESDGEFIPSLFPGQNDVLSYAQNSWLPYYSFSTTEFVNSAQNAEVIVAALVLDETNVVPNPYYGGASYEQSRLDNRVKIINLPERCIVSIYDNAGLLIRKINKDSPATYVDWDLKNERNVPVASGVHIIHISVPGVTEKVVKWMGVMRPTDLDNF